MTQENPSPQNEKNNIGQWTLPTIAAITLMLVMFGYYPKHIANNKPSIDFVCILNTEQKLPLLSIVGNTQDKHFWLSWTEKEVAQYSQVQLWAQNGDKASPLKAFPTNTLTFSLSEEENAQLRMASRLTLTAIGSDNQPEHLAEGAVVLVDLSP